MSWPSVLLVSVSIVLVAWAAGVALLVASERRSDARALVRFIPDCLQLFRLLLSDKRIPRSRKILLVAALGYLALPFDLVPDFIPFAGQLDDVIVIGLVLRAVLRSAEPGLLREHWPGPPQSVAMLERVADREALVSPARSPRSPRSP